MGIVYGILRSVHTLFCTFPTYPSNTWLKLKKKERTKQNKTKGEGRVSLKIKQQAGEGGGQSPAEMTIVREIGHIYGE